LLLNSMSSKAILLANLGSPDSYEVRDVRKYLNEFLMDGRVIDIPYLLRLLLVRGIIVPFRAPKSAAKYKSVWTDKGSPLIHISKKVKEKLGQVTQIPVEFCMRYGNPTPSEALNNLHEKNPDLKEIILIPLYPHYAMSSYETAVEHIKRFHKRGNYPSGLTIVSPFYNYPDYVEAMAQGIHPFLEKEFDHILFSYHGVPKRHIHKTDYTGTHCLIKENCCSVASEVHKVCYRHQVLETTKLVAEKLSLQKDQYSFSFQSRLGSDAWLQPYTAQRLKALPAEGIKKLLVVCPAFVSDCLETLEEINMEGRNDFLNSGGDEFTMIPCLNDEDFWINSLDRLANSYSSLK